MYDILLCVNEEFKRMMVSAVEKKARNIAVPASIEEAKNDLHNRRFDAAV